MPYTPLMELREPLRHLLGDSNPAEYQYTDAALDAALRTMVRMGKLQGYSVHGNRIAISPEITNPNHLALLLYETVKSFLTLKSDSFTWKTRAAGGSESGWSNAMFELENQLHELKAGDYFAGWQDFNGWWVGSHGLNPFTMLTRMNLDGPARTATFGEGGLTIS